MLSNNNLLTIHCVVCGQLIECELDTQDELGKLEVYHCYECDTLYTLRDGTINYLCDATSILTQIQQDIDRNSKYML